MVQIGMELFDERLLQFQKRHILHMVLLFHESAQMLRAFTIALPRLADTVDADTFVVILREFPERFEQRPVFPVETLKGVPDPFGRYIAVAVANVLIMFVDLAPDVIQMAIDSVGLDASAFRTAAFDFPQTNGDFDFGAELGDRAVDRDTPHDRGECLLLVPFEVEQNLERTAHDSAF